MDPEVPKSRMRFKEVAATNAVQNLDSAAAIETTNGTPENKEEEEKETTEERADCECNPLHRLTFSCSYKVEMCTFAAFAEK